MWTSGLPQPGIQGLVVKLDPTRAQVTPDGQALIDGTGVQQITLGETWVEEGTGGLYYTRVQLGIGA